MRNQIKKDYRKKQHPTTEEMEAEKARLYQFTTQRKVSKVFKCNPVSINRAFKGLNIALFHRIRAYNDKMLKNRTN